MMRYVRWIPQRAFCADLFRVEFYSTDGLNLNDPRPVIVVLENDIAKVLGNSLKLKMEKRKLVCIDSVYVNDGDYIDIGEPVAGGRVVPVVTKTLIFNR